MKRQPPAALAHEDRILWEKVARTVTPLGPGSPHRALPDDEADLAAMLEMVDVPAPHERPAVQPSVAAAPSPKPAAPNSAGPKAAGPLDEATTRRIARGGLVIEARIDLHGMTQEEAHGLLLSFIMRAAQRHLRTVLVITGKGRSPKSEGVLKRAVPHWLAQPAFARHVSGYADAARPHGGGGALYVRVRRPRGAA